LRILVDLMGGDLAPASVIGGAKQALDADERLQLTLIGRPEAVREARAARLDPDRTDYLETAEVIEADEQPAMAARRKRDSSIMVGMRLAESGEGAAFVSAGPTGALMTAGLMVFGRLAGVRRPALGSAFPNLASPDRSWFMLDIGANVDATPEDLVSYAVIGSLYVQLVLGIPEPRVGLLNVGVEPQKGSEMAKRAYELLTTAAINFQGNVEARDIYEGGADVVVCDGFVGNILLKGMEGLVGAMTGAIRTGLGGTLRARLGGMLARPSLRDALGSLDYTAYGGAPLFGLDGVCVKCHGSSNARAIRNGIGVAATFVAKDALTAMSSATVAAGSNRSSEGQQ